MTDVQPPVSRYAAAILRKIDHLLEEPLSASQRQNIIEALCSFQSRKHALEVRGVLPFHFARLYFVFLMGRDRRIVPEKVSDDLRSQPGLTAKALYWIVAMWPVYVVAGFLWYVLSHLPQMSVKYK